MVENPCFGWEQIHFRPDFDGFSGINQEDKRANSSKTILKQIISQKAGFRIRTRDDSQIHTSTSFSIEPRPSISPNADYKTLQFVIYSSPIQLMDGARDVIGQTLLARER